MRLPFLRVLLAVTACLLLGGCTTGSQIDNAILVTLPLAYACGLWTIFILHREWQASTPDLQLGSLSHTAALIVLAIVATIASVHADMGTVPLALWFLGPSVVSIWMILAWAYKPASSFGIAWGGVIALMVLAVPVQIVALFPKQSDVLGWLIIIVPLCTGGLGLVPLVLFILLYRGARVAARRALEKQLAELP